MSKLENYDKDVQVSLKLFVVLTRALQAIETKVVQNIKTYGLNLTEFAVLELLYHKGDQPIQKIGQKVLLASSSITYVVDKLEEKGFLYRKACPTDRRVTYASLTDEGQKLMNEVFPKHAEELKKIMGGLTIDEQKELVEKVKRLGIYAQEYHTVE